MQHNRRHHGRYRLLGCQQACGQAPHAHIFTNPAPPAPGSRPVSRFDNTCSRYLHILVDLAISLSQHLLALLYRTVTPVHQTTGPGATNDSRSNFSYKPTLPLSISLGFAVALME
ncbi:hypothetical protein AVEN_98727-1 [Araneus ventricosus]|uniref:Uncharacterized protein n=1 Tax=Araneus ventricosus TaxID=182803 RepID=A0A4Y2TMD2_ARAVE|nr:hypothetical protein AVEN_98727-1 [Araneus ventricosus]